MSEVNRPKALMRKVLRDREKACREGGGPFGTDGREPLQDGCGEALSLKAWPEVWQARMRNAGVIAAYRPLSDELGLKVLFEELKKNNVKVCYPKVCGTDLEFYEASEKEDFEKGAFSIEEPVEGLRKEDPENIGIVLIPAVAYGKNGKRIGRGKGFYDRFVSTFSISCGTIEGKYLIGVIPKRRLMGAVPSDDWDLSVDAILTEEQFIALAPRRERQDIKEASK